MSASIDELNAAAYQYQLSIHHLFNKICEPLFNLGIKYFYYGAHFTDGKNIQFSNHDELIRDHYLYIKRPGEVIIDAYLDLLSRDLLKNSLKSYFLVPYDKKDQDCVIDLVVSKKFWNCFVIAKREADCLKTYGFGTDKEDSLFSQFYFKNLALLEHFCDYFDENIKALIEDKKKAKFGFLKFPADYSIPLQTEIPLQIVQQFLEETFFIKQTLKTKENNIHLSKRELECLYYVSLGKTIKEIARVLELSPRSVEFYLNNVKKRSGLNRGELIASFARNFSISTPPS